MRILIADDNPLVRRGIQGILSSEPACEVCGEAANAIETLEKARRLRPDVVLLDVSMPGTDGLETARLLHQQSPEIHILMMSQHDPAQLLIPSRQAGAEGLVDKSRIATDLLPAVRKLPRDAP
jgi:DNA-binding NarL/FixJ family response regulator